MRVRPAAPCAARLPRRCPAPQTFRSPSPPTRRDPRTSTASCCCTPAAWTRASCSSGSRTSTTPRSSPSRSTWASPARTTTSSRARRSMLGAVETFTRRRARGVRHATSCCRRSRPTRSTGWGYPLFTALGRPLIAKLAVEYARRAGLRHDRPRLHRQGQRPGAHRGHRGHARARAEDHRAGALVGDGPRRGDRLRARARHPGQGRHRGRRRTRSTTTCGVARARASGSRTSRTRPRTTSSSSSRAPRRRPTSPRS